MLHMNLLIFCLLPNSNLQLALFVPSLLGPLCNSRLCILCIFFRNFSQLQHIHSWLNSDFHFSNIYVFLSTNGWYLFTSLFLDRNTHHFQEIVPQEFPPKKSSQHNIKALEIWRISKTNSRNASPNPALLPVPEQQSGQFDVFLLP